MRSLDHTRDIELLDRGANGGRRMPSLWNSQMRIKPIELPHLAVGAPAEIAVRWRSVYRRRQCSRRRAPRRIVRPPRRPRLRSARNHARGPSEWPARIGAWHRRLALRDERSRPTPARACLRTSAGSFRPTRAVVPGAPSGVRATPAADRSPRLHRAPTPLMRSSRSSRAAGFGRRRLQAPASRCRPPPVPRHNCLTGTAPSV